jgi:outer membrane lipoprotein-sorting protein
VAQGGMTGNIKIYQLEPDKVRSEIEIMGMKIVQAYDGKTAWADNPMAGGVKEVTGPDAAGMKRNALGNKVLLNPEKYGVKYVLKGKGKVEDRECHVLEQIHKNGFKATMYVDAKTFYLLKTKAKVDSSQGTFESEVFYEDYKKVNGILSAHKSSMHRNGTHFLDITIDKISHNQKIDVSIFSMKK